MKWFPLVNYSHYDIKNNALSRHSIIIPSKLVKYCSEQKYQAVGLCDHSSMAYAVKFIKSCKDSKIKPILGTSLKTDVGYVRAFAKNRKSFYRLYKLLNESLKEPLKVGRIAQEDILVIAGELESDLFVRGPKFVGKYKDLFGNNLYISRDHTRLNNEITEEAARLNIPVIDVNSAYYLHKEDSKDQLIPLALSVKKKLNNINECEDPEVTKFLIHNDYRILRNDEIDNLSMLDFADRVESFDITDVPQMYKFPCESSEELLLKLCRDGWKQRVQPEWDKKIYGDRVKEELKVITEADLSDYFLVVQDYVKYAKSKYLVGAGRGSVGGSLVAYLLGITEVDPIPHDLLFERFISAGRMIPDHVSFEECPFDQFN